MRDGSSVRDLMVEVGHSGVVSHMGLWVPVGFADRVGLGEALSEGFGESRVGHGGGSVLVHAMLTPAGGGEACTDIEYLRAEPGLFGEVASDSYVVSDDAQHRPRGVRSFSQRP